jgi:hypothetical protein
MPAAGQEIILKEPEDLRDCFGGAMCRRQIFIILKAL